MGTTPCVYPYDVNSATTYERLSLKLLISVALSGWHVKFAVTCLMESTYMGVKMEPSFMRNLVLFL